MKVINEQTAYGPIIKLEGKMMLGYEANDFHDTVLNMIEKNIKNIVVDLENVEFISSWGIGILMYGYTTASNHGCSFKLVKPNKKIKRTLVKVKVDQIIQQFDSIEEAFAS